MPRPPGAVSYVALLRTAGAPRAFTAAGLLRLSYGTVGLALLLTIHTATGSYAVAGAALGGFGLPGVLLPLKTRAIDRYGLRRVLAPLGFGYCLTLGLVAVLALAQIRTALPYVLASALAGLLTPPVGPVMRRLWADLTPGPAARQRAYALDSVVEEVLFAVSPVLVSLVLIVTAPLVALFLTAALALTGTLGLATSTLAEAVGVSRLRRSGLGPLQSRALRRVVLVMLALGTCLGPLELAVAAVAARTGHPAATGFLLAGMSVGSAAGGLLWGRRDHHQPHTRQLLALLVALAVGLALAGLVSGHLVALAVALAGLGLAVAPVFVVAYVAADQLSQPAMRTEATSWVATAFNTGVAFGAAGGGLLVDGAGPATVLLLAGAGLALSAVTLVARGGSQRDRLIRSGRA